MSLVLWSRLWLINCTVDQIWWSQYYIWSFRDVPAVLVYVPWSSMRRQVRKKDNTHVLHCPFKCGLFCRSTSGLTQHRNICLLNPANHHAWTPPTGLAFLNLSTPQSHYGHISQPHTPRMSPHWYQWTINGRGVRSRTHPLLNGDVIPSFSMDRLLSWVSV